MLIAGKILAKVLLNRLNEYLDQTGLRPKSQWDSGRPEEQYTLSLKQDNSEKCQEQNVDRTFTRPLSSSPKHLTQAAVMGFGILWQSLAAQPGS